MNSLWLAPKTISEKPLSRFVILECFPKHCYKMLKCMSGLQHSISFSSAAKDKERPHSPTSPRKKIAEDFSQPY